MPPKPPILPIPSHPINSNTSDTSAAFVLRLIIGRAEEILKKGGPFHPERAWAVHTITQVAQISRTLDNLYADSIS